jgi:hypothetical protein
MEVCGNSAHAIAVGRLCNAAGVADVGERAVAIVAIKIAPARGQPSRPAIHRQAFPVAIRIFARFGNLAGIEINIGCAKKIQTSVSAGLDKGAAGWPAGLRIEQSRVGGHIRKGAIPVVAIENVLSPVSNEKIVVAIVVVIAHAYGGSPARFPEPGLVV